VARIVFATDWLEETPRDYIPLLRTHLRLTSAELNHIFGNVAPHFR